MSGTETPRDFDNLIDEMKWRGFFEQCTDEEGLRKLLAEEKVTAYAGFDPTADSLHVGSLLPIMGLVHIQRHGHRPIGIVGGGTAMVGDPSGKTELRQMLTLDQIEKNLAGIRAQLAHFIEFGDEAGLLLNNADWLKDYGYIEFLRDVGRYFSVNQMLTRDSVKSRMEKGLSFIEFNYMILQAYDFMVLNRDHGCRLQVGGNDQWGNICSGIDLCRRFNQSEVYGLTFPLLSTATGAKMGKTADGAVWLDAERTSPYDFYQYWVNVDDRDVSRFLRLYTLLSRDRIEELEKLEGAEIRAAKQVLAFEVTATVHGRPEAEKAAKAAAALFGGAGDASTVPSSERPAAHFQGAGLSLLEALVGCGLLKSKGEARRMIRQNAVRVGGRLVSDEMFMLTADQIVDGKVALQVGKKRHHHINVV
ncbi:tyrosine--tRNA ligase [bacterium DOLJORAL78_65_58]|nr:MAG: tyrosine--tRNA ligase [bacterium DOLZORAL124_64_63]PIE75693.1 MAG: tyrosine--tRNA ligase [bacterium DOLJORAL78_65_58]